MIRDRLAQDLDRLAELLIATGTGHGRPWLQEIDAEHSWVFDQAPVNVAPTRNVIGHVQIHRSADGDWIAAVAAQLEREVDELRVIGRLFVKPGKHDFGVARYLLTEAVKIVEKQRFVAVLDPHDLDLVPTGLCERLRFAPLPTRGGGRAALVRIGHQCHQGTT